MTMIATSKREPWQAYVKLKISTQHFGLEPDALSEAQAESLTVLLEQELNLENKILAYAEHNRIGIQSSQLDDALMQVKQAYPAESDWRAAMQKMSLDENNLRIALERQLIVDAVLVQVAANLQPMTEQVARDWYATHQQDFFRPERRMVSHILLTIEDDLSTTEIERVQSRMACLRQELQARPEQFAALALRYSECPTAVQEGRIGLVRQGQLYPELDVVLFQMNADTISDVVRSPMGMHLLRCEQIEPAAVLPEADAIPKIIDAQLSLAQKRLQKRWLAWVLQQPLHELSADFWHRQQQTQQ